MNDDLKVNYYNKIESMGTKDYLGYFPRPQNVQIGNQYRYFIKVIQGSDQVAYK